MQPQYQSRPVMDVKAPMQRATPQPVVTRDAPVAATTDQANPALPVHVAPVQEEAHDTNASSAKEKQPDTVPVPPEKTVSNKSAAHRKPVSSSHTTAIIVTTIFVMAVLAGLTVVAYLKSQ